MMYGTTVKNFDGPSVPYTAHEGGGGGGGGEDDAPLEDGEGGHEEAGDAGVEDAAASSEDGDHGEQDDRGAASEDSDDDGVLGGERAVQVLAIRANFPIVAIHGFDGQSGRAIYRQFKGEVQEEGKGMVDLVPIGPRAILTAYGAFGLHVFPSITTADGTTTYDEEGAIIDEWDVGDDDDEPEEYTQTICCGGPRRKLEITYLVIPNAVETNVEVKLKLKDLGSRSRAVYGEIKASCADYGNRSVHLFRCRRGWSWSVPSGSTAILPLSPSVIALPYRRQLELHIEVDLKVIAISDDNQEEEEKNLRFTGLIFTRRIRSQQRKSTKIKFK